MKLQISVEETKEAVAHWLRTMKHVDVKPAQLEVITHRSGRYEDVELEFNGFTVDNVDLTRLID